VLVVYFVPARMDHRRRYGIEGVAGGRQMSNEIPYRDAI